MHLRTYHAVVTVTSRNGEKISLKVTQIDDRLTGLLSVGDEPIISNQLRYTVVADKGKTVPIFDFHSPKLGEKKLSVHDNIVVLVEAYDGNKDFQEQYWTTADEYATCKRIIQRRLNPSQSKAKPPIVRVDNNLYRLRWSAMELIGTVSEISHELYFDFSFSQLNGWPTGNWEKYDGRRRYDKCNPPEHPGANKLLEARLAKSA